MQDEFSLQPEEGRKELEPRACRRDLCWSSPMWGPPYPAPPCPSASASKSQWLAGSGHEAKAKGVGADDKAALS